MRCSFRLFLGTIVAIAAMLQVLAAHADDLRPGQVFKDCESCPEMVVIPAGSFDMGLPASGKVGVGIASQARNQAHRVTIGSAYALGKTEVTKRQWRAIMGVNPTGSSSCEDCPVQSLSWNVAQDFVRRLSTKTGKQYRLPSEAEWEYACRAGGQQEYCGGDNADDVAWHDGNSGGSAHLVATRQANAFGLYDMSGNVWEWTADCWNNGLGSLPADGSAWVSRECPSRVLRGGSWQHKSQYLGATIRAGSDADDAGGSDGVRIARTLP